MLAGAFAAAGKRFAVTECCSEGEQRWVLPVGVQRTGRNYRSRNPPAGGLRGSQEPAQAEACGYKISPRP